MYFHFVYLYTVYSLKGSYCDSLCLHTPRMTNGQNVCTRVIRFSVSSSHGDHKRQIEKLSQKKRAIKKKWFRASHPRANKLPSFSEIMVGKCKLNKRGANMSHVIKDQQGQLLNFLSCSLPTKF